MAEVPLLHLCRHLMVVVDQWETYLNLYSLLHSLLFHQVDAPLHLRSSKGVPPHPKHNRGALR